MKFNRINGSFFLSFSPLLTVSVYFWLVSKLRFVTPEKDKSIFLAVSCANRPKEHKILYIPWHVRIYTMECVFLLDSYKWHQQPAALCVVKREANGQALEYKWEKAAGQSTSSKEKGRKRGKRESRLFFLTHSSLDYGGEVSRPRCRRRRPPATTDAI